MVTIIIEAGKDQGEYQLDTGVPYSQTEQLACMGVFSKLRSLVKQAPEISRRIRVEVSGASVNIKKEGDVVTGEELGEVRRQLAWVIDQAEQELVTR